MNKILKLIKSYDSIIIFGHKSPDEDCYGSQVALKEAIRLKYPKKKVYISGSGVPKFFGLLSPMDIVSDEIISNSLAILVDSNNLDRIEDERVKNCKAFCKFDHHIDDNSFTQGPFIVNETANSTCDIIASFLFKNRFKTNKMICNALYAGILTDSGRFQFVTNYAETYTRVARLCKGGADPSTINKILNVIDEEALEISAFIYSNYKITDNGVIYTIFKQKDLKKMKVKVSNVMEMMNQIGNIRNYNVWAFFIELESGQCKIEVRSNGPKIQHLLAKIGGGGHTYAAGATLQNFDIKKINAFVDALDKETKNWKL